MRYRINSLYTPGVGFASWCFGVMAKAHLWSNWKIVEGANHFKTRDEAFEWIEFHMESGDRYEGEIPYCRYRLDNDTNLYSWSLEQDEKLYRQYNSIIKSTFVYTQRNKNYIWKA